MNFIKKLFGGKAKARKPDQCFRCGKRLKTTHGVMIGSGADIFAHISNTPYNCRSCNTAFCLDCMSVFKKGSRICPFCKQDIGW